MHICPAVLLEDLKPSCTAPTWSSLKAFLIPDATPATVISYGPFFPRSPRDPDVVEQSVQCCMNVSRKQGQEFTIITCEQAIYGSGFAKGKPPEVCQTYLAHVWLPYCSKFPESNWNLHCLQTSTGNSKMSISLYVKQKVVSVVSGQTWHSRKPTTVMQRQNSSLASVSSQWPWRSTCELFQF